MNLKKLVWSDLESSGDDDEGRQVQYFQITGNKWTIRNIGCGIVVTILLCTALIALSFHDKTYDKVSNYSNVLINYSNVLINNLDVSNDRILAEKPTSSPTSPSTEWDINWFQLGEDIIGQYSGDDAGTSIAVSRNGLAIALGAPGNGSPGLSIHYGTSSFPWSYTYIYKFINNTWLKVAELLDAYSYDRSGLSVALDD